MLKELLSVYMNWRFWSFLIIAFFPCFFGIIGGVVVLIEQKLQEIK